MKIFTDAFLPNILNRILNFYWENKQKVVRKLANFLISCKGEFLFIFEFIRCSVLWFLNGFLIVLDNLVSFIIYSPLILLGYDSFKKIDPRLQCWMYQNSKVKRVWSTIFSETNKSTDIHHFFYPITSRNIYFLPITQYQPILHWTTEIKKNLFRIFCTHGLWK